MPSNQTVQRQRAFGGALGVLVLGAALVYHFFPRVFHVEPDRVVAPRKTMSGSVPVTAPTVVTAIMDSERFAGPPLTLAPSAVIARRARQNTQALPEQRGVDSPQVRGLLERADKALQGGHLIGDDGAAALYGQPPRAARLVRNA